jgi:hypothetical protein
VEPLKIKNMSLLQKFSIGLCLVLAFYLFYYRQYVYNWFCVLWYKSRFCVLWHGRRSYELIQVIRYYQNLNENWEKELQNYKNLNENWEKKLQNLMEYLFKCKYSFTPKEKEDILKLLTYVDLNKYPQISIPTIIECPICKKIVVVKITFSFDIHYYGKCPNCGEIIFGGDKKREQKVEIMKSPSSY